MKSRSCHHSSGLSSTTSKTSIRPRNGGARRTGFRMKTRPRSWSRLASSPSQSLGYMRGRSITDTYIIIDEAQNMSLTQVLSMITRAGEGSKIVLLGDPDQIDNPFLDRQNNGLVFASEKMKGSPLCWQISFTEDECTRSPLAKEGYSAADAKGEHQSPQRTSESKGGAVAPPFQCHKHLST